MEDIPVVQNPVIWKKKWTKTFPNINQPSISYNKRDANSGSTNLAHALYFNLWTTIF